MIQHSGFLRWTAYLVGAALSCFLSMICANFGWSSDLFPALTAVVAVLEGSFAGGVFGLCLGMLGWLNGGGVEGILCCTAIGLAAGCLKGKRTILTCLSAALVGLLLSSFVHVLFYLNRGSAAALICIVGAEVACSLALTALVCPLFLLGRRRAGCR